jgi:CRP/FNR family cyclic AMP-dependent transcriptional regulator
LFKPKGVHLLSRARDLAVKKIFLIVSDDETRRKHFSDAIASSMIDSTIFTAYDGADALSKIANVVPHILITDLNLSKVSGIDLIQSVLERKKAHAVSIIIASEIPDTEHFVNEVVQGKVQFLIDIHDLAKLNQCIARALNHLVDQDLAEYSLRFLAAEQCLFSEGDPAESVFIVKKGKLRAYKGEGAGAILLGEISAGEFVGEMAHINQETRSASVFATDYSELIEIPSASLDAVLFSKPAWAQALMRTLSKRLKRSNDSLPRKP